MKPPLRDFAEVFLRLSENGSRKSARIRAWVRNKPPYSGCSHGKRRHCIIYPPKERRKAFVKRNSFIEMAKLHDLSGRITYISSHVKQEHLYEVYATEPDRAFWRELAKCNQEEFEKSGTNGKCIEARELMIALPESFINYDHDYLLKKKHRKKRKSMSMQKMSQRFRRKRQGYHFLLIRNTKWLCRIKQNCHRRKLLLPLKNLLLNR